MQIHHRSPATLKRSLTALLLGFSTAASATDAGNCYSIAAADARTYCLALAHNDSGRCYAIQNSALRSQCLAEVRKPRRNQIPPG